LVGQDRLFRRWPGGVIQKLDAARVKLFAVLTSLLNCTEDVPK